MFPPAQRSLGNSSTYGRPRANQSFLGRVQNLKKNFNKKFWALYKKSKKFLWIASTGNFYFSNNTPFIYKSTNFKFIRDIPIQGILPKSTIH